MAALPLGLRAWRWLGMAATPLAPLLLAERAARGKEERARMHERLGAPALGFGRFRTPPTRYPPARHLRLLA